MGHKNRLIFFLFLGILTSCGKSDISSRFIKDVSSIFSYKDLYGLNQIAWIDIFNQSEDEYFAYVYSETCSYCNKIKPEISYFCSTVALDFYFIQYSDDIPIDMEHKNTIGIKDVDKLSIRGTPTLFVIKNKEIFECYCGYGDIFEYLSSY